MFVPDWDQKQQRSAAPGKGEKKELGIESQDGRSLMGSVITRRSSSAADKSGVTSNSKDSVGTRLKRAITRRRLSEKRPSSYYAASSRLSSLFAENNYMHLGSSDTDQLVAFGVNHPDVHDEISETIIVEGQSDELSKRDTLKDQPSKPILSKRGQENGVQEELGGLTTPPSKLPTFVILTTPSTPEDADKHTSTDYPPTATLIQWLDEDSYITRTTTVTYEPRGDADINDQVVETIISADPSPFTTAKDSKPRPSPPIVRPTASDVGDPVPSFSSLVDNWFTALHGSSKATSLSPPSVKDNDTFDPSRVLNPAEPHTPISTQGFLPVPKTPGLPPKSPELRATDPDAWKPPDDWGCQPIAKLLPKTEEKQENVKAIKHENKNKDVVRVQKDAEGLAFPSPEKVLSRLAQCWDEPSETSPHPQEERDRKLLMLSVLNDMFQPAATASDADCQSEQGGIRPPGQRILALFESEGKPSLIPNTSCSLLTYPATASYLATTYSDAVITHLSLCPLPHDLFPNVQPLFAPPNKASIPFAADSFHMVHCLSLPSLVPAHETIEVLKRVYRCLAPDGILQLVLLDPFPVARRLGPRTRKWFEKHLLTNLQARSRCVRPSAVFPGFLEEAQLRVREERCAKMKFLATPPDPDVFTDDQKRIQAELRSVLGRMLWQEVWGKMVTGDDNWWDDPECVEECARLGTFFEFNRVEAVKLGNTEVMGTFSVGC